MQTIEREYTIKTINEGIENGNIVFNHPMQRKPGQWGYMILDSYSGSIVAGHRYELSPEDVRDFLNEH